MSQDDRVTVGTKVDADVRRRFRTYAACRDTSMSDILREKIDEVLEDADVPDELPEEQPAD